MWITLSKSLFQVQEPEAYTKNFKSVPAKNLIQFLGFFLLAGDIFNTFRYNFTYQKTELGTSRTFGFGGWLHDIYSSFPKKRKRWNTCLKIKKIEEQR